MSSKGQDSISIKKHEKIVYEDTFIIVKKDATIPFDKKIVKVKKRRLIRFYHNSLFVDTNEINALKRIKKTTSYKGKTVGDISITKVKPFGTNVMDTSKYPENWFGSTGNKIHTTTKDRIILNNLLFNEGDKLTRYTLEESERILRTLLFILDARIYGVVRKSQPEIVDIYVVTKDVFSKSVKPDIDPNNVLNIALEEINMFGLGQRFYNNIILSAQRKVGIETQYTVYNLYGSYLKGDINLAFTEDSLLLGISNERDFISPEIRNAGGFSYHYRELRYFARYDTELARTNVVDNNIDAWYGHSFPIEIDSTRFGHLNLISSGRVSTSLFTQRPLVSADTNLLFQNNTLLLANFGISHSVFAKDIFIEGFGVTEDIPTGLLADVTVGGAVGEFVSRTYFGWRIAHGALVKQGYFFNSVELGSFFHDRKASDGTLRVTSLYVSGLIGEAQPFKGRIFLKGQYIRGINRTNPSDQVDLRDVDALRGIESNLLFGNTVIAGGVTVSIFSPWQLLGFRIALFSIADLTYFSKATEFILSNRPYWGISSGVRLNNQNFILGTINLSISFYPAPPEGIRLFKVGLALNPIFLFPNFIAKKPSVVKYGNPSKLYY